MTIQALDADGAIKAALHDAPPYIHILYDLLKTSHDANAAANATNAAAFVQVSHALAENSRVLSSLAPRVDAVEQQPQTIDRNQAALSARHDADIAAVRAGVSFNSAVNQDALNHRSLEDPREIIVRGIPLAVQLEPTPLAAALLTALKLHHLVPFITGALRIHRPALIAEESQTLLRPLHLSSLHLRSLPRSER